MGNNGFLLRYESKLSPPMAKNLKLGCSLPCRAVAYGEDLLDIGY